MRPLVHEEDGKLIKYEIPASARTPLLHPRALAALRTAPPRSMSPKAPRNMTVSCHAAPRPWAVLACGALPSSAPPAEKSAGAQSAPAD